MKETINELNKKFEILSTQSLNLIKAMDALALIKFEDTEKKRTMIDELRQMEHKIGKERQNVIDAISALQKVCTHTHPDGKSAFISSGNDSHYSYEKCSICGKEEKC
jgi:hypothetical protein